VWRTTRPCGKELASRNSEPLLTLCLDSCVVLDSRYQYYEVSGHAVALVNLLTTHISSAFDLRTSSPSTADPGAFTCADARQPGACTAPSALALRSVHACTHARVDGCKAFRRARGAACSLSSRPARSRPRPARSRPRPRLRAAFVSSGGAVASVPRARDSRATARPTYQRHHRTRAPIDSRSRMRPRYPAPTAIDCGQRARAGAEAAGRRVY
jgi:hypothetical protein